MAEPDLLRYLRDKSAQPDDLRDWILGFEDWGDEISVRTLIALEEAFPNTQGVTQLPAALETSKRLIERPGVEAERQARAAWTEDAPWTAEVDWADLAADRAWALHWVHGEGEIRRAVSQGLLPWAQTRPAASD